MALRVQTSLWVKVGSCFIPILQIRKLTEITRVILASVHRGESNFKCSCWSPKPVLFPYNFKKMSSVEPGSHHSKPPISCIRDSARPVCSEQFYRTLLMQAWQTGRQPYSASYLQWTKPCACLVEKHLHRWGTRSLDSPGLSSQGWCCLWWCDCRTKLF